MSAWVRVVSECAMLWIVLVWMFDNTFGLAMLLLIFGILFVMLKFGLKLYLAILWKIFLMLYTCVCGF